MSRVLTHQEFSRKGGQSTSPAKVAAVRRNLQKALAARWATKKRLTSRKAVK